MAGIAEAEEFRGRIFRGKCFAKASKVLLKFL
jgi:hypothetical protein